MIQSVSANQPAVRMPANGIASRWGWGSRGIGPPCIGLRPGPAIHRLLFCGLCLIVWSSAVLAPAMTVAQSTLGATTATVANFAVCTTGIAFRTLIDCVQPARCELKKIDGRIGLVVYHVEDPGQMSVQVWLSGVDHATNPPLAGTVETGSQQVTFKPRFGFQSGSKYDVVLQASANAKPVHLTVEVPAESSDPSRVESFFPSGDSLPENTLKFYVHFSEPMRKGEIYQYIRILKSDGVEVELPFLEIEQEFWSRDSRRLTLLLDPGRIKRGLKPREEMGPIFEAGNSYRLVIDGSWPDSTGKKLGQDFAKQFMVTAEDHEQPNPQKWTIKEPSAGSHDPLVVSFREPLDHSMLSTAIGIRDLDSQSVPGAIQISNQETTWEFVPTRPWAKGEYRLVINPDLEDNVGNSVGRQFDVDIFNKTEPSAGPVVERKFTIRD